MTRKRGKNKLVLLSTLLIVITIPLMVGAILNLQSLDTRSDAAFIDDNLKCKIRFLYVDPNALEVNKPVTLEVEGRTPNERIESIQLFAEEGSELYEISPTLPSDPGSFYTSEVIYTPQNVGNYRITGTLTSQGIETPGTETYSCLLEGGASISARIVPQNQAPEFLSNPPGVSVNNIKVGDRYEYTVEATDSDSRSSFQYSYSFTPRAPWLENPQITKVDTGSSGTNLKLNFNAIADQPGSYLANVMIWDGYNGHTKSQSWVINVEPKENDIPKVTVSKPTSGVAIKQGEKLIIEWSAEDRNQIVKYNIYVTPNSNDRSNWKLVDTVSYKVGRYEYTKTNDLNTGEHAIVVEAFDNQTPAGVGIGKSAVFMVNQAPKPVDPEDPDDDKDDDDKDDDEGDRDKPEKPSDGNQINQIDIINIYPTDGSTIDTLKPTIKATLIASPEAKIVQDSIEFKLNDEDLPKEFTLDEIDEGEIKVFYVPQDNLENNSSYKVKVAFKDDTGNNIAKEWTFSIDAEVSDEEMITILGYEMSKRTALIVGIILLGLIILAILIPWLAYMLLKPKRKGDEYNEDYYADSYTPTPTPVGTDSISATEPSQPEYSYTPEYKPDYEDVPTTSPDHSGKEGLGYQSYSSGANYSPQYDTTYSSTADVEQSETVSSEPETIDTSSDYSLSTEPDQYSNQASSSKESIQSATTAQTAAQPQFEDSTVATRTEVSETLPYEEKSTEVEERSNSYLTQTARPPSVDNDYLPAAGDEVKPVGLEHVSTQRQSGSDAVQSPTGSGSAANDSSTITNTNTVQDYEHSDSNQQQPKGTTSFDESDTEYVNKQYAQVTQSQPQPQSQAQSQPQLQSQAQSQPQLQSQTQSQPQSQTQSNLADTDTGTSSISSSANQYSSSTNSVGYQTDNSNSQYGSYTSSVPEKEGQSIEEEVLGENGKQRISQLAETLTNSTSQYSDSSDKQIEEIDQMADQRIESQTLVSNSKSGSNKKNSIVGSSTSNKKPVYDINQTAVAMSRGTSSKIEPVNAEAKNTIKKFDNESTTYKNASQDEEIKPPPTVVVQ